ncbi:MAG: hypothetical protein IKL41_03975 [Clostridia bacterium]|nr:hypothetical protein [Clostridia bacterium]
MKKKTLNPITPMPKKTIAVWWICRGALLIWGINGLFRGYTSEFLQGLFAIAFTHLWDLFQLLGGKSFITRLPWQFQTHLTLFITLGVCIGSTLNNRTSFSYSDIVTHFFAGFIASGWSARLLVIMQEKKNIPLAPSIAAMAGFGMGVAVLVGWEFYEFTMDKIYGFNLQVSSPFTNEGLIDTMWDFILGAGGALTGMFCFAFADAKKRKQANK